MRKAKRKEKTKGKKDQTEEKKKKKRESKVAAGGSLGVVLFKKMPLKIELWKLKTTKMCFQFP